MMPTAFGPVLPAIYILIRLCNKKPQAPRTENTKTKTKNENENKKRKVSSQEPPTEKSVTTPETPGHDDDPDRIDDVV